METTFNQRALIHSLGQFIDREVLLRGWIYRLRVLAKTTFILIKDCSGEAQCVVGSDLPKDLHLKLDDCVEVYGHVRADHRSRSGYEVDVMRVRVLNRSATGLPFNSSSRVESIGQETLLEYRPLAVRNDAIGDVFRIQAAALKYYREHLSSRRFIEIITSKIMASGTENGTNLFELK